MLQAIDLSKRYEDGLLALDHMSLDVKEGEIFCLLGANGAGKTTTINLFLNFIEPTDGQALINGIDVTKDPLEAKKYVSYVSENVMLYGNFTAKAASEKEELLLAEIDLSKVAKAQWDSKFLRDWRPDLLGPLSHQGISLGGDEP